MDTDEQGSLLRGYYPDGWDEFIGQPTAKRDLLVRARSARARGVPLGHVLLRSPMPGIGKTSLALLTAREMGGHVRISNGPVKPADVPLLFLDLKDGDFLFLDEVHRLADNGKRGVEWLLYYLENGLLQTPFGVEEAPAVTVIAATTDAGKLPTTILGRFPIKPELEPYGDADGALIAAQLSRKVLVPEGLAEVTPQVAARVARAANNSPRDMRNILCAVRDLVWAEEIEERGGDYDLAEALAFSGITEDGLPRQAVRYLQVLWREYRGNPAGAKVLAERLGEVASGLSEVERILLDKGLIKLTGRGRMLSPDGMRRARDLAGAA